MSSWSKPSIVYIELICSFVLSIRSSVVIQRDIDGDGNDDLMVGCALRDDIPSNSGDSGAVFLFILNQFGPGQLLALSVCLSVSPSLLCV